MATQIAQRQQTDETPPTIRVDRIIDSSRLINIHVIDERVYYVYLNSLCVAGCVIKTFDSRAVASCLCGNTIAIVLDSGTLLVPSPETLLQPDCHQFCEERIGMTSHKLFQRKVAATASGRYIAVNVSKTSILIYEYVQTGSGDGNGNGSGNGDTHFIQFCRTINVTKRGSFQLTGDLPHLWHLHSEEDSYQVDVFEAGETSPVGFPDEPIAKCPIVPFDVEFRITALNEQKVFLHSCHLAHSEGVLCFIDGNLIQLNLRQAMIGDILSGMVRFPSTWLSPICTVRRHNRFFTYVCRKEDRKIVDITESLLLLPQTAAASASTTTANAGSELPIPQSSTPPPITTNVVGKIPFAMSTQKFHLAIVNDSKPELSVIVEPHNAAKVKQLVIDARKLPRRALTLGDTMLVSRTAAVGVRSTSSVLSAGDVQTVRYISELKMLLAQTNRGSVRCYSNKPSSWMMNENGESHPKNIGDHQCFELTDFHSAGVVGNHTLALVSTDEIRLFSNQPPFPLLGTTSVPMLILEAVMGSSDIVLRTVDQILALRVEPGYPTFQVLDGITTTFISLHGDLLFAGLDISLSHDYHQLSTKYKVFAASTQPYFTEGHGQPLGAIIEFILGEGGYEPVNLWWHDHVPTGLHFLLNSRIFITIYGFEGLISHSTDKHTNVIFTRIDTNLQLLDAHADLVLLGGSGMTIVSASGCQRLVDQSKSHKNYPVSSACFLSNGIIAYVSRQDLRLMAGNFLELEHSPLKLKQMPMPVMPPSVQLKMMLIPSQRVLILHGDNMCTFYDSVTFDQLLVTGMTVAWCENITIWKFESGGHVYEHLVIADGKGWIETYSFRREGLTLEFDCKFRAALFDQTVQQRTKEIIYGRSGFIYISRGEYMTRVTPGLHSRRVVKKFPREIRCINHNGNYLIVSTVQSMHILDNTTFEFVASMPLSEMCADIDESVMDVDEDSTSIGADQPQRTKEIKKHVSAYVNHNGMGCIYILSAVEHTKEREVRLALAQFSPHNQSLVAMSAQKQLDQPGTKIRNLQADPDLDLDRLQPYSCLRVYATLADDSIAQIEVLPPQPCEPEIRVLF